MRLMVAGMCSCFPLAACGDLPTREVGFRSTDPAGRVEALRMAASAGDHEAIPGLISCLDADDAAQRMLAREALRRVVGTDAGYAFDDPEPERRQAVRRWQAWWEAGGTGIPTTTGEPAGVSVAPER